MALTKYDLAESVYGNLGISKAQSIEVVDSLLEIIKNSLGNGEDVLISGFGKFYLKDKNERRGRNPLTGEDLTLDARRIVSFRCSECLKNKLNGY